MTRFLALLACIVMVLFAPRAAAAAGKCSDIPLRVTLYNNAVVDASTTPPTAVASDIRSGGQGELFRSPHYFVATRASSGSRYTGTSGRSSSPLIAGTGRPCRRPASCAAAASRSYVRGKVPSRRFTAARAPNATRNQRSEDSP